MRLCSREDFEKFGKGETFDEYNSGIENRDILLCFPKDHFTTANLKNKINDKLFKKTKDLTKDQIDSLTIHSTED